VLTSDEARRIATESLAERAVATLDGYEIRLIKKFNITAQGTFPNLGRWGRAGLEPAEASFAFRMEEMMTRQSLTILAIGLLLICAQTSYAQQVSITYDKNVVTQEGGKLVIDGKAYDQAKLTRQLSKQLSIANRDIKKIDPKAKSFTTINVTKDCCASVTCGGGKKLECCVTGPGACESGVFSVACVTSSGTEISACGAGD